MALEIVYFGVAATATNVTMARKLLYAVRVGDLDKNVVMLPKFYQALGATF